MFGLKDEDIDAICTVLQQFKEVEEALIFGSRAKGNYKNGSDVDIALKGEHLTRQTANSISGILNEETLMPYYFDVLSYQHVTNIDLKEHIDRVGIALYTSGHQKI